MGPEDPSESVEWIVMTWEGMPALFEEVVTQAHRRLEARLDEHDQGRLLALVEANQTALNTHAYQQFWKPRPIPQPQRSPASISLKLLHRALGLNVLYCKNKDQKKYEEVFESALRLWLAAWGINVASMDSFGFTLERRSDLAKLRHLLLGIEIQKKQVFCPLPNENMTHAMVPIPVAGSYLVALCGAVNPPDPPDLQELLWMPWSIYLERAMASETPVPWSFIKGPVASGLIWEIRDLASKQWVLARVAEDGTLADQKDRPVPFSPTTEARVAHPAYWSSEDFESWRGILDDYGILQPFKQVNRPVFRRAERQKWLDQLQVPMPALPGWVCFSEYSFRFSPELMQVGMSFIKIKPGKTTKTRTFAVNCNVSLAQWSEIERAIRQFEEDEIHRDPTIDLSGMGIVF